MSGIDVDGPRPAVQWVTSLPVEWRLSDSERLVLLCLACDAFKDESAPGYDAVAEWTGLQRTSCIRVLDRLTEETRFRPALLERISFGGRRRTIWRLLTDIEPVVDTERFEVPERRPQPKRNRSTASTGSSPQPVDVADQFGDGSNRSTMPTGSSLEPSPNSHPTVTEPSPNRSTTSTTPFALSPSPKTQRPSHAAAVADDVPEEETVQPQTETLDLGIEIEEPPGPNPVQVLVAAYVDRVRGRASRSLIGAIGRNVKRLIETDGFEPALILAAIEEAAPQGRRDLDRIIAAPGGPAVRFERGDARRAMFAHWAKIAAEMDARGRTA